MTKDATAVDTRVERPTKRLLALEAVVDHALDRPDQSQCVERPSVLAISSTNGRMMIANLA